MSRSEAILIVSRAVSFYLLIWVFDELTGLPVRVREVLHYMGAQTPSGAYFGDNYNLGLVFTFLRLAVLSAASIWFYRCGPRIQAFFLPEPEANGGE